MVLRRNSYIQGREACPHLIEIRINYPAKKAERRCALEEDIKSLA